MKMEKEKQLVIDLIKNSINYELGQLNFTVDGDNIDVFEEGYNTFHATRLIGLIESIDKVHCYLAYNKETDRVILKVFP